MTIDTAMVLAAGLGTRIRSLNPDLPKPLIEVSGKALIDYAIDTLREGGVTRFVVNLHHKAEMIERHLRDRSDLDVRFSDERERLLETGGGIVNALPLLGEKPFFCTNTDAILLGGEPASTLRNAWADDTDALLLLVPLDRTSGYAGKGDFSLDAAGRIVSLRPDQPLVFTGLQLLRPSLFEGAAAEPISTRAFWHKAQERGRMKGVVFSGDWMHVGDPEGHRAAQARL
jgi:MurNAc alpha-1-phosphate uridylyltransferase